jgi:type IV pilus assembly protein PilY1
VALQSVTTTDPCGDERCPVAEMWHPDPARRVLARYYRYEGDATAASMSDSRNYVLVEINRDQLGETFPTAFVNNAGQQRVERSDCAAKTSCTWAEEAQNFANWYTYYRTRLMTAIAVSAEAMANLRAANSLDSLRLGYGSINYFPLAPNPYASDPVTSRLPASVAADPNPSAGSQYVDNIGAVVRGVRSFSEGTTDRQQVFNWLFSLRTIGSTPNREAVDSVGRYYARKDSLGPWADFPGVGGGRATPDHISCRRNYMIMITDGEWTNVNNVDPTRPQQPRIEDGSRPALPGWIASQGGSPLNALTSEGPLHTGQGRAAGRTYKYTPGTEVEFSTNASGAGATLSDVSMFWFTRDLRDDLPNNIDRRADGDTASTDNRGRPPFWQNLTSYIVGYGLFASRDAPATRDAVNNKSAVSWPAVNLNPAVITDRDTAAVDCPAFANGDPSGCGRVDDTLRASLASRGNFLSATDVARLATSVAEAFQATLEMPGAATALAARSALLRSDDLVFLASFRSIRWTGKLLAYRGIDWLDAVEAGNSPPAPVWQASVPEFVEAGAGAGTTPRKIFLSNGAGLIGGIRAEGYDALPAELRNQVTSRVYDYLRGARANESGRGGDLRSRDSLIGDIVNSTPLYSKAPNFHYEGRRPAAAQGAAAGSYRTYVQNNAASRQAAVYVGANGGFFHAFNADTGSELFSYVPRAVYGQLSQLASTSYVHRYFVDGPVVECDYFDTSTNSWRTVVVGTTGNGPASIFALDVTTPDSFGAANVLWDVAKGDSTANAEFVGHINTPGFIASAKDKQWYYFTGNGLESENDRAAVLAINLRTGAVHAMKVNDAAELTAPYAGRPNGMGGITPVYDGNRNVVQIYAGDKLGRLWKFDLSSITESTNLSSDVSGKLMFFATDVNGAPQPIMAAPRITGHPLGGRYVAFGTGKFVESKDRTDLQVQTVYALREGNPGGVPVKKLRSDMQAFNFTQVYDPVSKRTFRELNGAGSVNWQTRSGWLVDLRVGAVNNGERIIHAPIDSLGYLTVTSYEPVSGGDPCLGGGKSFFYRFDLAGNFTRDAFDNRPVNNVGVSVEATVSPQRLMGKQDGAPVTPTSQRDLSVGQLNQLLATEQGTNRVNCGLGVGSSVRNDQFAALRGPCAVPGVRVWREMPRGPAN